MTVTLADLRQASRIEAEPPYTPHIGVLVAMMYYARLTTLQAVGDLNTKELDTVPSGFSNSVGMLLAHIAAVDRLYQRLSFQGRGVDAQEGESYAGAFTLGKVGKRVQGVPLERLLTDLEAARADTLVGLARRDDAWLATDLQVQMPGFADLNHHWAWFHVMEDELSHRGQIRLLRKTIEAQSSVG
jgi:uncharacterized damage-inducible protein DinB